MNMELSRSYHSSLRAPVQTDRSESRCANSNFPQADFWTASLKVVSRHNFRVARHALAKEVIQTRRIRVYGVLYLLPAGISLEGLL